MRIRDIISCTDANDKELEEEKRLKIQDNAEIFRSVTAMRQGPMQL